MTVTEELEQLKKTFPFFKGEEIETYFNQNSKSREILAIVSPEAFLALAEKMNHDTPGAREHRAFLKSIVSEGAFNSIPRLLFENNGEGVALSAGHEGRNRMMSLYEEEVNYALVVIHSLEPVGVRWGQQYTPESYDYLEGNKYPSKITSENGDEFDFFLSRDAYKENIFSRVIELNDDGELVTQSYLDDTALKVFSNLKELDEKSNSNQLSR